MTQCSLGCWAVYHTGTVWTLSPAAAATLIAGGVGLVVVPPCIDTLCTDWAVLLGPHLLSLCHRVTVSPIPSVSPAMIVTDPWSWPRVTPVCIVCIVCIVGCWRGEQRGQTAGTRRPARPSSCSLHHHQHTPAWWWWLDTEIWQPHVSVDRCSMSCHAVTKLTRLSISIYEPTED